MGQTSSEMKSERDIVPPMSRISDPELIDIDTPPGRYSHPEKRYSQSIPQDVAHARHSKPPTTSSDYGGPSQSRSPPKQTSRTPIEPHQQPTKPKNKSKSDASRSSAMGGESSKERKLLNRQANDIHQLELLLDENSKEQERQKQQFQNAWQQKHEEHSQQLQGLCQQIQDLTSDRDTIYEKYQTLIRTQQEESFEKMESGRWLPLEESRVQQDFARIRNQMRTWAKAAAVKNIATLQDLGEEQHSHLIASLSHVAVIENIQLPSGLSTSKGPSLLLNALLAHDIYTSVFRNPFYFLDDNLENVPTGFGVDRSLNKIYSLALDCKWEASRDGDYLLNIPANVKDAHMWRSQTLRLLLPPRHEGNTDGEKNLHQWTNGIITKVAELHASRFIASSARHLLDSTTANVQKLHSIYREAAPVAYMLWTRKIGMRLSTLSDLGSPTFDIDDSRFEPHTMVHPDDHDDKLKGRKITLIVHPLLEVYGTDEGKDYDHVRVWAPAEAWFNTK